MATIGENIRRLRIAHGFKRQGDFAAALKVPQSRLSDWETDRYEQIELENLLKIAVVLKVDLDQIVSGLHTEYDALISSDPLRHSDEVQPALHQGGAGAAAATRIRELETRLEGLEVIIQKSHALAEQLVDVTIFGAQADAAARAKARRGGDHR